MAPRLQSVAEDGENEWRSAESGGSGQANVLGLRASISLTEHLDESASPSFSPSQRRAVPQIQRRPAHQTYFREDKIQREAHHLHEVSRLCNFQIIVDSIKVYDGLRITNHMTMATHAVLGKPMQHQRHRRWTWASTRQVKIGQGSA